MNGVKKDLLVGGIFVLVLTCLFLGSLAYLDYRAQRTDALPILQYAQPVWSEDESKVAYFRLLMPPDGQGSYTTRQLWWAHRLGTERKLIAEFPPEELRIVAWVDEDRAMLLQPPGVEGEPPTLIQVAADGSYRRTLHFNQPGLSLVSVRGGEVFFQRQDGGAVQLLSWSPGQQAFHLIARFPATGSEKLNLEEVAPSPDKRYLSVVLATGGSRGLWLCDRTTRKLRFTFVTTEGESLRTTWAPDSQGLVAAAELSERCELYLLEDLETGRFTHLSAPARSACVPFWPRELNQFLLLEDNTVMSFDRSTLAAERLLDRIRAGRPVQDLAVSARGNWAAYHSRSEGLDDLYIVSLRTSQAHALLPPGQRREMQSTLLYQIGSGTRYAVSQWMGGSARTARE